MKFCLLIRTERSHHGTPMSQCFPQLSLCHFRTPIKPWKRWRQWHRNKRWIDHKWSAHHRNGWSNTRLIACCDTLGYWCSDCVVYCFCLCYWLVFQSKILEVQINGEFILRILLWNIKGSWLDNYLQRPIEHSKSCTWDSAAIITCSNIRMYYK